MAATKKKRRKDPEIRPLTEKNIHGKSVPQFVRVLDHVSEHREDLSRFVSILAGAPKKHDIITDKNRKQVPRNLRRRALSHNSYRLPQRLRPSIQAHPLRPIRVNRRRRNFFASPAENDKKKLLHTHLWHAKRFVMKEMYNCVIPMKPRDKGIRSITRAALNRSVIHDMSYMSMVQVGRDHLPKLFQRKFDNGFYYNIEFKNYSDTFCDILVSSDGALLFINPAVLACDGGFIKKLGVCQIRNGEACFNLQGPKCTAAIGSVLKEVGWQDDSDAEFSKLVKNSANRFVNCGDGKTFNLILPNNQRITLIRHQLSPSPSRPLKIQKCLSGWKLLCTGSIAREVWRRLQYNGCVAIGLDNYRDICTLAATAHPLFDMPDASICKAHLSTRKQDLKLYYDKRPPAHKPNFKALGVDSPFISDFTKFTENITVKRMATVTAGLLPISIHSLVGFPSERGLICMPSTADLEDLLASLSKQQWQRSCPLPLPTNKHEYGKGNVLCLTECIHKVHKGNPTRKPRKKNAPILLPTSKNSKTDTKPPAQEDHPNLRESVGRVTSGMYCHARGHGFGLGCVSSNRFDELRKVQGAILQRFHLPSDDSVFVWIRNVQSLRYTPAFVRFDPAMP